VPTEKPLTDTTRMSRRQDAAVIALTGVLGLVVLLMLPGRWYALGGFALGALTMYAVWMWDTEGADGGE
jgi:4-hydroxybenzoate polyprenyltransferase